MCANDCSRQRRMYEVWHHTVSSASRLCVSAWGRRRRIELGDSRSHAIAIYHRRSDRDPRTSPQTVARATFRDRPGRRCRDAGGDRTREGRLVGSGHHRGGRPCGDRPRAAHRCSGRPAGTSGQARPAVRRRREAAPQDPVLGDGHAQPHADLGIHLRSCAHRRSRRRRGPARQRRCGVLQLRELPRRRRRRWRRLSVLRRRGTEDVPPHRRPGPLGLLRHRGLQRRQHPGVRLRRVGTVGPMSPASRV